MEFRLKEIDQDLHKQFKVLCVKEGKTMQEVLRRLMKEYVERQKKDNRRYPDGKLYK